MIRSGVRARVFAIVGAFLAGVLVSGYPLVPTSGSVEGTVPASPSGLPPRTGIWPVNLTLYGDAIRGWGFNGSNISEPGPSLTVHFGDEVNLTLIGADATVMHSFFVDYTNDSQPSPGEPASPDFMTGSPLVWNFSAMTPGTWTYRCGHHPNSMTGMIVVLEQPRPVNLTLYGDAGLGWGFSNATIREPGPPLVVLWGTTVTLTLVAHDLADHSWFIDYNNDTSVSPAEPASPTFNMPVGKVVVWPFVADQTGNWTYRCGMHPFSMTGTISIVGGPSAALPRAALPLITEIMAGALILVLGFAVIYHVRTVRAAKRTR